MRKRVPEAFALCKISHINPIFKGRAVLVRVHREDLISLIAKKFGCQAVASECERLFITGSSAPRGTGAQCLHRSLRWIRSADVAESGDSVKGDQKRLPENAQVFFAVCTTDMRHPDSLRTRCSDQHGRSPSYSKSR